MKLHDDIHNYYEKLVLEELAAQLENQQPDEDYLSDTVCVALNHLPARYFRHGVDMAFYLSSEDYSQMKAQVKKAVSDAIEYMKKSDR